MSATTKGNFTIWLYYFPSSPNDKPPPSLNVLFTQGASARAQHNANGSTEFTLSAKAGANSAPAPTITVYPADFYRYYPIEVQTTEASEKRIITIPTQDMQHTTGGGWEKSYTVSPGCQASAGTNSIKQMTSGPQYSMPIPGGHRMVYPDDFPAVGVQAWAWAQQDNRSVTLSRGVGNDAYGIPLETSALRTDGSWHTYGDSIYSAKGQRTVDLPQLIPLDIAVSYSGSWKTTALNLSYDVTPSWNKAGFLPGSGGQWAYSGWGYTAYGSPTVYQSPFSISPMSYTGAPTGAKTFDTSYTATDNGDQATATAFYHLTLHDPVEPISAAEGEPVTISHYRVKSPMSDASGPLVYHGPRADKVPETTIKIGTSTELGLELKATLGDIPVVKDLLGFVGEASAKSTYTISVDTEAKVPAIDENRAKYLFAIHDFSRRHARFYKYNESGKVRRFVTQDSRGRTYNPAIEKYQEAIRDTAVKAQYDWGDIPIDTDPNTLPRTVEPEPQDYDFSGGRS